MNLSKSFEFFDPALCKHWIHIIGCGSVGSTVAELLTRHGLTDFMLYDFDEVKRHNVVNQIFRDKDVGKAKVEALSQIMMEINPEVNLKLKPEGWTQGCSLDGYVFLCVDDIELRAKIVKENRFNNRVKAMFDFRTGLTDAQHFAADWSSPESKKIFLETMGFSHEEAALNQQMSACNVSLCVAPTVRLVANVGVVNFINFLKGNHMYKQISMDAFNFEKGIDAVG